MSTQLRPVILTTEHRGVFFGYATDTSGSVIQLKDARMAIRWRTKRGLIELAEIGPNAQSIISCKADIEVRKVTAVIEVSEAAQKVWDAIQ